VPLSVATADRSTEGSRTKMIEQAGASTSVPSSVNVALPSQRRHLFVLSHLLRVRFHDVLAGVTRDIRIGAESLDSEIPAERYPLERPRGWNGLDFRQVRLPPFVRVW
jgi:hypothetical protein